MAADKKRTQMVKGREVNFVFLPPDEEIPFDRVTSVAVIPFQKNGFMVGVLLERGIDIPGGHVQEGESSIEQVARREAREEACLELGDIHVVAYIQSDYHGSAPDELTYMVITTAFVTEMKPFVANEESGSREVLEADDFLARYKSFDVQAMAGFVADAKRILGL